MYKTAVYLFFFRGSGKITAAVPRHFLRRRLPVGGTRQPGDGGGRGGRGSRGGRGGSLQGMARQQGMASDGIGGRDLQGWQGIGSDRGNRECRGGSDGRRGRDRAISHEAELAGRTK